MWWLPAIRATLNPAFLTRLTIRVGPALFGKDGRPQQVALAWLLQRSATSVVIRGRRRWPTSARTSRSRPGPAGRRGRGTRHHRPLGNDPRREPQPPASRRPAREMARIRDVCAQIVYRLITLRCTGPSARPQEPGGIDDGHGVAAAVGPRRLPRDPDPPAPRRGAPGGTSGKRPRPPAARRRLSLRLPRRYQPPLRHRSRRARLGQGRGGRAGGDPARRRCPPRQRPAARRDQAPRMVRRSRWPYPRAAGATWSRRAAWRPR